MGKPFKVGDSLTKDTRNIDQIRLPLCYLGVTKVTCTMPTGSL